jgi:predicted DNA binding CopG/RHH family protein
MKKKVKSKTKKSSPYMRPSRRLDGDCAGMLEALERGEPFERIEDYNAFVTESKRAAAGYFKKNARVSFRISETDLDNVKRMAASEGLPYQTFLTGIIHKLTTGQLAPRRNK